MLARHADPSLSLTTVPCRAEPHDCLILSCMLCPKSGTSHTTPHGRRRIASARPDLWTCSISVNYAKCVFQQLRRSIWTPTASISATRRKSGPNQAASLTRGCVLVRSVGGEVKTRSTFFSGVAESYCLEALLEPNGWGLPGLPA